MKNMAKVIGASSDARRNRVDGVKFTEETCGEATRVFVGGEMVCTLSRDLEAQTASMVEADGSVTVRRARARGSWVSHWGKMRREAIRRFLSRKAGE